MDRKERIREYRQTSRPIGLFIVRNTSNDKMLVGTSTNLPGSLNRHRFQLELGSHADRELQAEWNAAGPDSFVIEVLDELEMPDDPAYDPSEDLKVLRDEWIAKLIATGCTPYCSMRSALEKR